MTIRHILPLAVLLVVAAPGCTDSLADNDEADDNQFNTGEETDVQSCGDDETYRPDVGDCIEDPNAEEQNDEDNDDNDTNPEDECDDDEYYHPIEDECRADDDDDECLPGDLEGRLCADRGIQNYRDVIVEGLDCDGNHFSETTTPDLSGYYALDDLPPGTHDLITESGSWTTTGSVVIEEGELTVEAEPLACPDLAVATGDDDIGEITAPFDAVNLEYDALESAAEIDDVLADHDELRTIDALFVEDQAPGIDDLATDEETVADDLQAFIDDGHRLLATENSLDYIRAAAPEMANFPGGGEPVAAGDAQSVTADVDDSRLEGQMGAQTVVVEFPEGWPVLEEPGDNTEVLLSGDVTSDDTLLEDVPLMLRVDSELDDGGRVVYAPFRLSDQSDALTEAVLTDALMAP